MSLLAPEREAHHVELTTPEELKLAWVCYLTEFKPHAGQLNAIQAIAGARFAGLFCGRRWGKSKLLARVAVREALEPNRVVWIVAPFFELTKRVFRPTAHLLKHVLPRKLAQVGMPPIRVVRSLDSSSERLIELSNGTIIQAKSADNPDSLLGEGLHLALLDESARMPERIWQEYILPTLLDFNGRSVHATSPQGFDWNHCNYVLGQPGPGRDPEWRTIQSPTWENSYLPAGAIDRMKAIMSTLTFRQEIGAEFTTRSGRVFPDFTRERHVRPMAIDPALPVCLGIDFGFRTFAWVAAQVEGETLRVCADGEWHDITTGQAIRDLMRQPWARRVEFVACDPAGNAVNIQSGIGDVRLVREAFRDAQIAAEPWRQRWPNLAGVNLPSPVHVTYSTAPNHRNPEWRAGKLRDRILTAAGDVHLYVSSACRGTIRMLEQSVYPENRPKDEPVKDGVNDHLRDALGYLLCCKFHRKGARWLTPDDLEQMFPRSPWL